MNKELMFALSNADAVACREGEVRSIMHAELDNIADVVEYDKLGSIMFKSAGTEENPVRILFTGHMDEAGFMVRYISDIGMVHVIGVGGPRKNSVESQIVRIKTRSGEKVRGVLFAKRDADGTPTDMYIDFGCETAEEVRELGIEIGDWGTFAAECELKPVGDILLGKAFDDRAGVYVVTEAMKRLVNTPHAAELWFAGSSSEEVGCRGAQTATAHLDADIVIPVDIANPPEFDRGWNNSRKNGHGPMIVHYDRMHVPNEKLLHFIVDTAEKNNIPFQRDLFKGGGTDAGTAHLVGDGKLATVIGVPLRYCHGSWSVMRGADLDAAVDLVCALATSIDRATYEELKSFE